MPESHQLPLLRSFSKGLDENNDAIDEGEAIESSFVVNSSPQTVVPLDFPSEIPFLALNSEDFPPDDGEDPDFEPNMPRRSYRSDEQKAAAVLAYMKQQFSKFSLRDFLGTIFRSDEGGLKNWANIFLKDSAHVTELMDIWCTKMGSRDEGVSGWVIDKAASLCAKEASHLTDRASIEPHQEDANFLRVTADRVSVVMVEDFRSF